ncbi:NRPS-like enzyme [Penicillium taxi]|uniref:NRPS-like enzyme n=1 Tax=Penicillium taxi TaxID=168475 RepID=UPI00254564C1|nr:NRPS-like enzyme [Penicillium taxi]KAJ5900060.1 NRPS-like enzyme [Penicillium taxi]
MSRFHPENELLPKIIDHYAHEKPDKIYAEYPKSLTSYDNGFEAITYRDFANVINGIAQWLTETFGPGNDDTLAYVGPNDLRYPALVIGAIKANYCMFFPSPRNSVAANESLFKNIRCTRILTPTVRSPLVATTIDSLGLTAHDVPGVDELLAGNYAHFPYTKTYPESANDRFVVLHTSGSTGLPKPVTWCNEVVNRHIRMTTLKPPKGFESIDRWTDGKRQLSAMPPFHAAGIAILLFISIPADMTVITTTSGGLPTAADLVKVLKATHVDNALLPPSLITELAYSSDLLDYASKHLDFIAYGGGDLPQTIGDIVATKVKLVNRLGATEIGMLSSIQSLSNNDPLKDWRYINFHPELGVDMRRVTEEEYELVMVRSPERERHQLPFNIFPELKEYSTHDLWVRHPDKNKADLWRWSARTDDVIVFLNGEKTNPISMEQHIVIANQEVNMALVAGTRRSQASLLVCYSDGKLSSSERAVAIEKIWPSIEEANMVCPAHARIAKTHILFVTSDKPMVRLGKGTVSRAGTIRLYAKELDQLYSDADQVIPHQEIPGPGRVDNPEQVFEFIGKSLAAITGWGIDQISSAENLFHLGLDSLHVLTAARSLAHGLDLPSFAPSIIYLHPSLDDLTQAALQLVKAEYASKEAATEAQLRDREDFLQRFLSQIEGPKAQPCLHSQSHTVILTGSTGSLGTYLLDTLLKNPRVSHIHCLNRRANGSEVQSERKEFYNLTSPLDPNRVTFWHTDLSQNGFGLDLNALQHLQDTTTVIIHNGWNVNFNLSLPSFKPDLSGVTNLINFAGAASRPPRIYFISSIGSVVGHITDNGLIPEKLLTTTSPGVNGYSDSKYIAEHLLGYASDRRSLRTSFARVGQIAGAVRTPGLWNKCEWFPSLVLSSMQIGALPYSVGPTLGRIDWVPIDFLAEILVELALSNSSSDLNSVDVSHPLNLHPSTWSEIRPIASRILSELTGRQLEAIPLGEWVQRVRQDVEMAGSQSELQELLEKNPAAKILEFFEAEASNAELELEMRFDTEETSKVSGKLRDLNPIHAECISKWILEWIESK